MKSWILIFAVFGAVAVAAEAGKKGTPNNAAAAASPSVPPGPPKSAVEIAPRTYRHVDAQGKAWLYYQTPFGWMKAEQKPGQQTAARSTAPVPETRVVDDGASVRFERNTPFGPQRWTRKKSEMTEEEKQILERASRPARTAESAKSAAQE